MDGQREVNGVPVDADGGPKAGRQSVLAQAAAFSGYQPAGLVGAQGLEPLQVAQHDQVGAEPRGDRPAVFELEPLGDVQGDHPEGGDRVDAGGHDQAQVVVQVPTVHQVGDADVVVDH